MKIVILFLISLGLLASGCAKTRFSALSEKASQDDDYFGDDDDDVIVDPPGDDDDDETVVCPRYDLVVVATDSSRASRNYRFVFNSEMKQTATQGDIEITFQKNSSSVPYTMCSGEFINTSIMPSFKPLDATEEITKQIVIYPGRSCTTQYPEKQETILVVDAANSRVLFDENKFRNDLGACAFGYTATGESLRQQIIQFAQSAVDAKAARCN